MAFQEEMINLVVDFNRFTYNRGWRLDNSLLIFKERIGSGMTLVLCTHTFFCPKII